MLVGLMASLNFSCSCSTSSRAAAGRWARGGRDLGGPQAQSPGCAAGPTRATSTSPRPLPIAYTVSMVLLGASLLLIYADLVKPVNLGG